jgi:N-acetylglucosamine kinase-like BadF-type ATPase
LLNESLELRNDLDICAQVYGPNARSRGGLAQLSQLVAAAANQGDTAARDIFQRAGSELAQIVDVLRRKLGYETGETVKLSYSGGAFSAGELLLDSFNATLRAASPNYQLVQPLHPPHIGAALYAAKLWKAAHS